MLMLPLLLLLLLRQSIYILHFVSITVIEWSILIMFQQPNVLNYMIFIVLFIIIFAHLPHNGFAIIIKESSIISCGQASKAVDEVTHRIRYL